MTIATYSELLAAVAAYADRDDLATVFPMFLKKIEATLNRRLDDPDMEVSVTLTGDGADLPADYGSMVSLGTADDNRLTAISNQDYAPLQPISGTSRFYTIREGKVYYAPGAANPTLVYRRTVPPLTSTDTTNWLLTRAPDVYFNGAMFEQCLWERDVQAAQGWKALFEEAVDELMTDGSRRKWGAGPIAPLIRRT